MKLLGLTGGVATGKSTVSQMLSDSGCGVVDTDLLARQIVEPGTPALAEIAAAFGAGMCDSSGRLRRAEMARLIFADTEARRRLEGILHPRIRESWQRQVDLWRSDGHAAAVVVIPLLFETGAAGEFEAILCTACKPESQRERCLARGWTPEETQARLEAQWPIELKIARSDFLIWSEGDLSITREQVSRVLRQLNLHPSSPSIRLSTETLVS